jgi:hypothetical protein
MLAKDEADERGGLFMISGRVLIMMKIPCGYVELDPMDDIS